MPSQLFTLWDVESSTLAAKFPLDVIPPADSISTTQAYSPTHSVKFSSADGSGATGLMYDLGSGHSTIYARWRWWLSSTTVGGAAGRHGFRFSQRSGDQFFSHHEFDSLPSTQWGFDILDHDGGYDSSTTFHNILTFPKDQFFRFAILLTLSSPGTANGVVRIWVNDVIVLDNTAVQFVGSPGWTQFDTFALNTNWDSGTGLWYKDDIEVWDGDPGGGASTLNIDEQEWLPMELQTNPLTVSKW